MTITSTTVLLGTKLVKGDRDAGYVGFGTIGQTTRGGSAEYQAVIANISDIPVRSVVLIDTLPIPGDTGVLLPGRSRVGLAATVRRQRHHRCAGHRAVLHLAQPVPDRDRHAGGL